MTKRQFLVICLAIAGFVMQDASALEIVPIDFEPVIVCPVKGDDRAPPAFTGPECKQGSASQIDPQNTAIWVKAGINIPASMRDDMQPNAVYVSGKTSSRVYFNGHELGQNGTPSLLAKDEFPGKIDAKFYVPAGLIQQENNQDILLLSSHHGFLSLGSPINFIGFGSYDDAALFMRQSLWISLFPLGALVLGALYFLVMSLGASNRQTNILFLLMSSLAACQLFAEISRTLFSYSYPFHDIRLLLIVILAVSFGACLLRYTVMKLELGRPWRWTLAALAMTILAVIATPGFDPKTTMAILIPTSFCTALIAYQFFKQRSSELMIYFGIFLMFTTIVLINLNSFHDILFYYVITATLCFLFIQQALQFNREKTQRKAEQAQVAKLQFGLQQNKQQDQPQKLRINSAGKTELIDSGQVAYCQAAGDYVDLYLKGDKHILFSGNLKELETLLPSTFLRVHRSYLVNLAYVQSLSKKSADSQKASTAGGFLLLSGDYEVPVSRRIMPMVRSALTSLGQ